jgi:hypothetical protein
MTETTPTLASAVAALNSQESARRAELARLTAEAQQAADKAAESAEAARRVETGRGTAGSPIMPLLRDLSRQLDDARQAALTAVRTGDGNALESWLAYRRLGAALKGRWSLAAAKYTSATGLNAPEGPRMPSLVNHAGRLGDGVMPAEDFSVFLVRALEVSEKQILDEAFQAALRELNN